MRRKLAAGNWKMFGTSASLSELRALAYAHAAAEVDIMLAPPATLIHRMAEAGAGSPIAVAGQDCHADASGAHTGDISADMLRDAGASMVILGHSERRTDHAETNDMVRAKTEAAWAAPLTAVVCIGETEAQRRAGDTLAVLEQQLRGSLPDGATADNTVIAYEPVWAIGTGLVPTLEEIAEVHQFLRTTLAERFGTDIAGGMRLLYGGSVKPGNAAEIFATPDVDGALVGGASLKAEDFSAIITALSEA